MTLTARRLTALVLATVALVGLTGCTASSSSSGSSQAQPAAEAATEKDSAEPDSAVVITGRIAITTSDPLSAATEATAIVGEAGGRVSGREERAGEDGEQAQAVLTLRIPADALETVRTALAALGTVTETTMETTEVGAATRDLDARITTLRTSIARYTEWLGTADSTSDLIELESAIAERQTELEGLETQARDLADQVSLSTVTLALQSEHVPVTTAPENLGEAIAIGWSGFISFWTSVVIALGLGLPWLVLLLLTAVVIIWLVRRSRRREASAVAALPAGVPDAHLFAAPPAQTTATPSSAAHSAAGQTPPN